MWVEKAGKWNGWRWGRVGAKSKYLQLSINHDLNHAQKAIHHSGKRLRWGWKVKGLSYVRRSLHSQGTNLTGPRVRRDEGKPLLLSTSLNLWVSSLLLLTIYPEKRFSANGPSVTLGCSQSFILSDSSLHRIKSFNPHSLYCLTHMSKWKSCAMALSWFFTASWSIFLIRWGETNDLQSIDLVAVIGKRRQWQNLKSLKFNFCPAFHIQLLNISPLLPLN